jgi:hypothetical protein
MRLIPSLSPILQFYKLSYFNEIQSPYILRMFVKFMTEVEFRLFDAIERDCKPMSGNTLKSVFIELSDIPVFSRLEWNYISKLLL